MVTPSNPDPTDSEDSPAGGLLTTLLYLNKTLYLLDEKHPHPSFYFSFNHTLQQEMDISNCGEVILVMPANNPDILLVTADNIRHSAVLY